MHWFYDKSISIKLQCAPMRIDAPILFAFSVKTQILLEHRF